MLMRRIVCAIEKLFSESQGEEMEEAYTSYFEGQEDQNEGLFVG